MRGRIVPAAVAAGAVAITGAAVAIERPAADHLHVVAAGMGGGSTDAGPLRPQAFVLAANRSSENEVPRLAKRVAQEAERAAAREAELAAQREAELAAQRAAQEAAARPAPPAARPGPRYAAPTVGRLTSGYGSRWGSMHWGIDIANRIGTPILAVAAGTVVEAGPASGFGLWVRIRHADGTITVYGHIDRSLVRTGQRVEAGQQIATMGNRGDSTGPHLHFEVWNLSGAKINPLSWLGAHGVTIRLA